MADVKEDLGGVDHKDLADVLDGLVVAFVDEFVVVLAGEVFLLETGGLIKLVVVGLQTPAHP